MKSLKTAVIILTAGAYAGLVCQDDDLQRLTQALRTLSEKAESSQEKLVGERFATNCLVIVTECSAAPKRAMSEIIAGVFQGKVPLLCTERSLRAYAQEHGKSLPSPGSYRYFHVTEKREDPYFLLSIPSDMISGTIRPSADNLKISQLEKSCGLRLEHFTEITDVAPEKLKFCWPLPLGKAIAEVLPTIFVPRQAYQSGEVPPRWILVFQGHGRQYESYSYPEILADPNHTFIEKPGEISGIASENLKKILEELNKKISIALLHIGCCFGGGINIGYLLRDEKTGLLTNYPFIITTETLTGDGCTRAEKESQAYGKFFSLLRNASPSGSTTGGLQDVYAKIPEALSCIIYPSSFTGLFPAMKKVHSPYFEEVALPEDFRIKRIDSNLLNRLKREKKQVLNVQHDGVLLYTNHVPITLNVNYTEAIRSAIPGSTFHILENIIRFSSPEDASEITSVLGDLRDKTYEATKLFHIKKWESNYGAYEVWVIKNNEDYESLIKVPEPEAKDGPFIFRHFFLGEAAKNIENRPTIEEANSWIKKFDEQIVSLKKLANAQAPYRFLKDAQIETLPWDA